MVQTKEENLALMARTKKGRNPFAPKKFFHAKKKEINKNFDKSNILYYYYQNSRHFAWNFHTRKRRERRIHASTDVKETSKKETTRKYYLVSIFSKYLIMR